ncbi:MAG: MFS transporter [Solirubrobacterales bacterium]
MVPTPYKRLMALRQARLPLLGALIGRLPIAALSLSTIIMVRHATGSFVIAGAVEASVTLAVAVSFPVQGRLVDRLGQTTVLVPVAALNPIALGALVVAAQDGAGLAVLAPIGAACGATIPALSSCMRTLWADLVPDDVLRQSAFALDAVLLEACFIVGPLITGGLVALGSPSAAVLANASFSAIGTLVFAASRASRAWVGGPTVGHWTGPLRSPGVVILLFTEFGFGMAIGAMEISITAFATQLGSPGLAGTLIAVQAAASMAGGLWYGSREHRTRAGVRYPRLCLLIALGFAPLVLIGSMASALPLMALSGFAFAPAGAVLYLLIDELAPAGSATETSTWMITAVVVGVAAGTAFGGAVVSGGHSTRGFAAAALAATLSWLVAFGGRRVLAGAPEPA